MALIFPGPTGAAVTLADIFWQLLPRELVDDSRSFITLAVLLFSQDTVEIYFNGELYS